MEENFFLSSLFLSTNEAYPATKTYVQTPDPVTPLDHGPTPCSFQAHLSFQAHFEAVFV